MSRTNIIIPTYNEIENISPLIRDIFGRFPDVYITVVDDNSPDKTHEAVKEAQKNFPNLSLLLRNKKEGLGKAYINAFHEVLTRPDVKKIVMMDADFSHHPAYLPALLKKSETHDLVIGSRYVKGGNTVGWELWRRILSRMGNHYCRTITGMPIKDCTAGFMVINSDLLKKTDFSRMDLSGYAFLMELKYLLWKSGASVGEVPIVFKNRMGGESKISSHIVNEGIFAPWKIIQRK